VLCISSFLSFSLSILVPRRTHGSNVSKIILGLSLFLFFFFKKKYHFKHVVLYLLKVTPCETLK
jgi:hypothetical protein